MDLSNLQTTNSTGPMLSDIVDNSPIITPSKRDIFLSTYRRQNFTFPNSIMHYTAINPKNSKTYQKMVKRCKYFFIKNPILVLSYLRYDQNEWKTCFTNDSTKIDIHKLLCKLWITGQLNVSSENISNNSVVSSIVPKIFQCDLKYLFIHDQVMSLNEFMILCLSPDFLTLKRVTVKNDDGTVVSFDKLIEQLPNVTEIKYTFITPSNNTSKNTIKELWKNPHLSNYFYFSLYNIPEDFDIDSFYSFMKKNKKTRVSLEFSDTISDEYKTRLEAIIDEIIETKNHEYKPPSIEFPGLDRKKFVKARAIFSFKKIYRRYM